MVKRVFGTKKGFWLLIFGLFILLVSFLLKDSFIKAGNEGCTIGFVSIQAIFQVHPEREKAELALQARAMELQGQLEDEAQELEVEQQQKLLQRYQQELSLFEQELIGQVIDEIEETVAIVARQEGISVVLEASHVIYGGVDLTEKVIGYLEQE